MYINTYSKISFLKLLIKKHEYLVNAIIRLVNNIVRNNCFGLLHRTAMAF